MPSARTIAIISKRWRRQRGASHLLRPSAGRLSRQQCLIAHDEDIVKPSNSTEDFQYEAELVAVIGKPGRNVTPEQALDMIFGWTIGNDVSERTWQRQRPDQHPRQEPDTFKPMGPFIVQGEDMAGCARTSTSMAARFTLSTPAT